MSQSLTVPKILSDTDTDTFFRYQIFTIPIPVLFTVPKFSDTGSKTFFPIPNFTDTGSETFFRYHFFFDTGSDTTRKIFKYQISKLFNGDSHIVQQWFEVFFDTLLNIIVCEVKM